jgi:hypothetical protein
MLTYACSPHKKFLKNGMDTALDATKNVAHGLARRKSKKNVNDTEDIPPPPPFPSDLLDLPEGEDGEKKKLKKRLKSSSSTGRRSVRHQLTREFAELATDLDLIKIEIDLIIKSYTEETGAKLTQQRLTIKDSPEERILEKMLESPYQSLFKLNNKSQASIALAPAKPLMYKEIIIPKFNINSIGEEERQSVWIERPFPANSLNSVVLSKTNLLLLSSVEHTRIRRIPIQRGQGRATHLFVIDAHVPRLGSYPHIQDPRSQFVQIPYSHR